MNHPKAPDFTLLQDYPTLNPSIDTFIHNDGTTVNLLNANGYLFVSHSSPPIAITIWLHENYPYMAPIVFVTPNHNVQNSSKPSICGPFWCHQICIPPSPKLATSKVQPHRRCAQPCQNSLQLTIPCSVLHLVLASLIRLLCQKWRL